jgi:LysM repeat protein
MKKLTYLVIICLAPLALLSQNNTTIAYIEQYKDIAIQEMKRTGIPASITLAQAILESSSGESVLAKKSNNHFGIKCKLDWKGETVFHDDDTKQECFRAYPNVNSSFKDHSDFLKNRPNYAPLFQLDPVDDSAWAYGLKKAGYATASDYPKKLLKVIDDYELSQYNFPELLEEVEAFSTDDTFEVIATPVAKPLAEKADTLIVVKDTSGVAAKPIVFAFSNPTDTLVKVDSVKSDTLNVLTNTNKPLITDTLALKVTDTLATVASAPIYVNKINGIIPNDTLTVFAPKKINSLEINSAPTLSKPAESANNNDTSSKAIASIVLVKPIYNYPKEKFRVNQVPAVWANAGTSLLSIASAYNVSLFKLFEYNHLKETDLLEADQLIFIAPKKKEGNKTIHIVKEGETLYAICQSEGIQLKYLLAYNNLQNGASINTGTSLLLVKPKEQKNKFEIITESLNKKDTIKKEDWNFFKRKNK